MYYEEKIIDGILCWRSDPQREFQPFTLKELTKKILEKTAQFEKLNETLTRASEKLDNLIN